MSLSEVEYVLRDCALHEVKNAWMMNAERRSKLGMVQNLMEGRGGVRGVHMARKGLRQITKKLRGVHS